MNMADITGTAFQSANTAQAVLGYHCSFANKHFEPECPSAYTSVTSSNNKQRHT